MDRLARTIFRWRRSAQMAQEGSDGGHKFSSRCAAFGLWYGGRARRFSPGSAGALGPVRALAQGAPAIHAPAEDFFYREDWFGEPWRKPETAVLIHGNEESSLVWYAWMPRMGQEFRVVRPDLPGLGRSRIPAGFEWSLPSLAAYVAHVMDKAGVDSAHIVGAKAGGAIAMQFAADYPARTRTLSVVHVPVVTDQCRHSFVRSQPQGAARQARLGCLERDGRILGEHVCDGVGNHVQRSGHVSLRRRLQRKTASCSASKRRRC